MRDYAKGLERGEMSFNILLVCLTLKTHAIPRIEASSQASDISKAISTTLLRSARGGWPSRGVLLTYYVAPNGGVVVQVSATTKGADSFSSVRQEDLLVRRSFNPNGNLMLEDARPGSFRNEVPAKSLLGVIRSFVTPPRNPSLFVNGARLNVTSNKKGYQLLLMFPSKRPGDWMSFNFDKTFKMRRKTEGY